MVALSHSTHPMQLGPLSSSPGMLHTDTHEHTYKTHTGIVDSISRVSASNVSTLKPRKRKTHRVKQSETDTDTDRESEAEIDRETEKWKQWQFSILLPALSALSRFLFLESKEMRIPGVLELQTQRRVSVVKTESETERDAKTETARQAIVCNVNNASVCAVRDCLVYLHRGSVYVCSVFDENKRTLSHSQSESESLSQSMMSQPLSAPVSSSLSLSIPAPVFVDQLSPVRVPLSSAVFALQSDTRRPHKLGLYITRHTREQHLITIDSDVVVQLSRPMSNAPPNTHTRTLTTSLFSSSFAAKHTRQMQPQTSHGHTNNTHVLVKTFIASISHMTTQTSVLRKALQQQNTQLAAINAALSVKRSLSVSPSLSASLCAASVYDSLSVALRRALSVVHSQRHSRKPLLAVSVRASPSDLKYEDNVAYIFQNRDRHAFRDDRMHLLITMQNQSEGVNAQVCCIHRCVRMVCVAHSTALCLLLIACGSGRVRLCPSVNKVCCVCVHSVQSWPDVTHSRCRCPFRLLNPANLSVRLFLCHHCVLKHTRCLSLVVSRCAIAFLPYCKHTPKQARIHNRSRTESSVMHRVTCCFLFVV